VKFVVAFGRFWYDFIVGDSVLLAIGGLVVLAAAWLIAQGDVAGLADVVLPLLVVATLWVSLPKGRRGP
jgi:hypothetical protein